MKRARIKVYKDAGTNQVIDGMTNRNMGPASRTFVTHVIVDTKTKTKPKLTKTIKPKEETQE